MGFEVVTRIKELNRFSDVQTDREEGRDCIIKMADFFLSLLTGDKSLESGISHCILVPAQIKGVRGFRSWEPDEVISNS